LVDYNGGCSNGQVKNAAVHYHFPAKADLALALLILAGLQGARQMARINGIDILDDVITQVRNDLGINS